MMVIAGSGKGADTGGVRLARRVYLRLDQVMPFTGGMGWRTAKALSLSKEMKVSKRKPYVAPAAEPVGLFSDRTTGLFGFVSPDLFGTTGLSPFVIGFI